MATYSPRPDGLVNVTTDGGRVLPMAEAQAQAGGATLAPPMPALPPPNPYSMIASGEAVAGPGGGSDTYTDIYGIPHKRNAPPSGFESAVADAWHSATAPRKPGAAGIALEQKPPGDIYGNPIRSAPPAPAATDAPVARETPEGLTRIDPRAAIPQGPPGIDFGQNQPGRIVQTSKGGDMRASFIRKPGETLDPAAKAYADSIDPEAIASRHETATTNAAIAADNAVATQIDATRQAESELEQQRAQVAQNRAALQQKLDIVDQREREAANATPQTRREVLQSRGALAGVLSGLSIALGGYVQGLRGGENPGLKILNDSIESEISSQRAKWGASKDKIGMARSDFGQAMQLYGDPNMAEADMRMRALTLAANMAGAYKTQGANQEWLANQQMVTQQLAGAAAAEKQKWKTLADGQVLQENYVNKPATYAQVGGPAKLTKEQRELTKDARERQIRLPDGSYAYAVNPAHVRLLQDKITAANNTLDAFAQIRSLLPKGGGPVTDLDARKKINALQDRALSSLSASEAQGVVTKADAERANATLSDINAIITDGGAGLAATESVVRNNMEATVRDNTYADPDATTPTRTGKASTFKAGL